MAIENSQVQRTILGSKPDAVFVGFAKAGTNYLRKYFRVHPDVQFNYEGRYFGIDEMFNSPDCVYADERSPHPKELCVLDSCEDLAGGLILTEGPEHTYDVLGKVPYSPVDGKPFYCDPTEIALRIKKTVPDAKILITLRNQVDWLRSFYLQFLFVLPPEDRSFQAFLNTRVGKSVLYSGHFNRIIETYFQLFGRDRVHVMLLEEFGDANEAPLRKVCDFLGIPHSPYPPDDIFFNTGTGNVTANLVRWASKLGVSPRTLTVPWMKPLYNHGPVKRAIRRYLSRDCLSSRDRAFIHASYSASNHLSSGLLGRDLSEHGYPI